MVIKKSLIGLIIILGVTLVLLSVGLLSLKLGSYYYLKGDMLKAVSFYNLSGKIIPFWKIPKVRLKNTLSVLEQDKAEAKRQNNITKIGNENITIENKNIFTTTNHSCACSQRMVAGMFKNGTDMGIPLIKISRIVLLYNNKVVATKDFTREIFLVAKGELPFQLLLPDRPDNPVPTFDDFIVDFEIPPFIPNEKAINLKVVNSKIVSASPRIGESIWDYKVIFTVLNDTSFTVSNIYRITFLKYKGNHLGEYRTSGRVFTEVKAPQLSIINLDSQGKKEYERPTLKPGEKRELEFNLVVDEEYQGRYDPREIELVGYFTGVMEK